MPGAVEPAPLRERAERAVRIESRRCGQLHRRACVIVAARGAERLREQEASLEVWSRDRACGLELRDGEGRRIHREQHIALQEIGDAGIEASRLLRDQRARRVVRAMADERGHDRDEDGRSVGVIDLRSLVPFDDETVCAAVRATGRAVVIAEAPGFASMAAEIAARVSERCFHHLLAPVRRVTGFDTPFAPPKLEKFYLPDVDRVLDAVDALQWEDA